MSVPDPLNPATPTALDDRAPLFEWLAENSPDRATASHCREYVHRMDVLRAAQPPVVNVTVPGVPGHFTGTSGTGEVAYKPGSPP